MEIIESILGIFKTEKDIQKEQEQKVREQLSKWIDKYIPSKTEYTKKLNGPKYNNTYIIFHVDSNDIIHFKNYKVSKGNIKLNNIIFKFSHKGGNTIDIKNKTIGTKCIVELIMEKIKYIPEIVKTYTLDGRIYGIGITSNEPQSSVDSSRFITSSSGLSS